MLLKWLKFLNDQVKIAFKMLYIFKLSLDNAFKMIKLLQQCYTVGVIRGFTWSCETFYIVFVINFFSFFQFFIFYFLFFTKYFFSRKFVVAKY